MLLKCPIFRALPCGALAEVGEKRTGAIRMKFDIAGWQAWAPGLATEQHWQQWCAQPYIATGPLQPDLSFLPAMQRRRLSPLARMVFQTGWPLAEQTGKQPVVFCSRHGETPRNLGLLTALGQGEALSPTHFSLSVHNAIIGLWSIFREDDSEMTALAASHAGLELAVLEAVLLLQSGAASVLVLLAEDEQPQLYRPWIDDVPFAHALALQIVPGGGWQLEPSAQQLPECRNPLCPPALTLLPLLLGEQKTLQTGSWRWSRV